MSRKKSEMADTKRVQNFLAHYGIMGMKWGIRRRRGKDGLIIPGTRESSSRSSAKTLSTEELRERVQRLNLEKQYRDLTKTQQSQASKFIKDVLVGSAKNVATQQTTKGMTLLVEKALKEIAARNLMKKI